MYTHCEHSLLGVYSLQRCIMGYILIVKMYCWVYTYNGDALVGVYCVIIHVPSGVNSVDRMCFWVYTHCKDELSGV